MVGTVASQPFLPSADHDLDWNDFRLFLSFEKFLDFGKILSVSKNSKMEGSLAVIRVRFMIKRPIAFGQTSR